MRHPRPRCRSTFKLSQGRVEGPRHDPQLRHSSPEWGPKENNEDVHKENVNKEDVNKTTKSPELTTITAETSQTRPQAGTQRVEADIRANEVQCNLQTTPKPVEKGHHWVWLIPVTINQVATVALL